MYDRANRFFDADATLVADFGRERLSGTIDNFIESRASRRIDFNGGEPSLTLEAASIGWIFRNGAQIAGDTRMRWRDLDWRGVRGAQFFGSPANGATGADLHPGSVAGAFGATTGTGDSTRTFIGAFGAYR